MNFLGHAYIARNHPHLIAGNFAGDAYKGNLERFNNIPKHIIQGVKLHRFIDDYTDQSAHILEAGHLLHKAGITRIAYIATDIILDHYLAKNWQQYSNINYKDFINFIYHHTDKELNHLEQRFQFMYSKLKQYGWFYNYPSEKGIQQTLNQLSTRIRFKNDLGKCLNIYLKQQKEFDKHFAAFLVDINTASVEILKELSA